MRILGLSLKHIFLLVIHFGSPAKLCVSLTHIILFVVSESEPENRKASGISSGGPARHSLAACPALSAGHGVRNIHRMHCTAYSRVLRFATYAATDRKFHGFLSDHMQTYVFMDHR